MPIVLTSLALLLGAPDKPANYARPELLVEPAVLAKEVARGLRILDARGKSMYIAGHVPGAVWIDATTFARSFGDGGDQPGWEKRIGALGINIDTPVAIYDDAMSKDAGRIWWILRYWGVKDVRLINGGWRGYLATGGSAEKGDAKPVAVVARLSPRNERLATKGQLKELVTDHTGATQIVDARSAGEYCGTEKTAKRNGAIPGAAHLEWSDTLDSNTGRFKSAAELMQLFRAAGIDPHKPALTYCQSGGRASVMAFALELMGSKDVRNYYKSWAEWGNEADTPVVKPSLKK
jgi:thiosulfate/3-mercaptopyruvate sulfurtransferase